jgi:hypothetical protein
MKYDGNNWVTVGTPDLSAGEARYTRLAIDNHGVPYVAYTDKANSEKATVKKYDGNNWVAVGKPGLSAGMAGYLSLAIDNTGVPYVAYLDEVNDGKATVMKYVEKPNAVDLLSFAAKATANGTTVKWTTANEQDIIAFNLYRGIPQIGADCTSHNPNNYHLVKLGTINSGQNAYQFDDHFTAVANITYCYGLVSLNDRGDIVDILGVTPRQ